MRWVITREREDCAELVHELRARGVDAVCIPAIERRPLPWPSELDVEVAALFLTSPYAAKLALAHFGARGDVSKRKIAALSPSTRAAVEETGARVDIAAEGGAVRLAEACATARITGDVVYPTSDAGLTQPEQEQAVAILGRAGCIVRRACVYTTTAAADLDVELGALGTSASALTCGAVLYSPSAARAFHHAAVRAGREFAWCLCVGESTLDALNDANATIPSARAIALPAALVRARDVVTRILELDRG